MHEEKKGKVQLILHIIQHTDTDARTGTDPAGIRSESIREVEWRCRYVIMGLLISRVGWITTVRVH